MSYNGRCSRCRSSLSCRYVRDWPTVSATHFKRMTQRQEPHVTPDMSQQWPLSDKIFLEPDMGDPRQSTLKALPSPPKTPRRVMMKYRFSGVFPIVFTVVGFVLLLVVMLAGREKGKFDGYYLVAVCIRNSGQRRRLLIRHS
jgi:hypothetical protein